MRRAIHADRAAAMPVAASGRTSWDRPTREADARLPASSCLGPAPGLPRRSLEALDRAPELAPPAALSTPVRPDPGPTLGCAASPRPPTPPPLDQNPGPHRPEKSPPTPEMQPQPAPRMWALQPNCHSSSTVARPLAWPGIRSRTALNGIPEGQSRRLVQGAPLWDTVPRLSQSGEALPWPVWPQANALLSLTPTSGPRAGHLGDEMCYL